MEDREKMVKEAKEMVDKTYSDVKNMFTFIDKLKNTLPEKDKNKIDQMLKKINMKDISKTASKVTKEVNDFVKNYKV